MKLELTRLEPIRTANIVALVYGIMMLVIMLILSPFLIIAFLLGALAGEGSPGFPEGLIILFLLVLYPIMGLVFGWITGLVGAWGYNLIAAWFGGIRYDVQVLEGPEWRPGPTVMTAPESQG